MEIMSFNIRCDVGTTLVGEADYWPRRETLVTRMFREYKPDIVGIQELMDHQIDSVLSGLGSNYGWAGEHRAENGWAGERNAIFYNKDVVESVRTKTFALSDTPEKLGSVTWNNKDPRIFTCMDFQDKATKKLFTVVNTHFDHKSEYSRRRSAELIKRTFFWCTNVIVMGDFNSVAGKSVPYNNLTQHYQDTFLAAKKKLNNWGTLGRYKEPVVGGERVDWILCSPEFRVDKYEVLGYNVDGEYPSDHYPVTTTLRLE